MAELAQRVACLLLFLSSVTREIVSRVITMLKQVANILGLNVVDFFPRCDDLGPGLPGSRRDLSEEVEDEKQPPGQKHRGEKDAALLYEV